MARNDQIILDKVLKERQNEVDPDGSADSFFEFFTQNKSSKTSTFHTTKSNLVWWVAAAMEE